MKNPKKDFCTVTDELCHAELHLLLELGDSSRINFIEYSVKALAAVIKSIKATLRVVQFYIFFPHQGIAVRAAIVETHRSDLALLNRARRFHEFERVWE